MKHCGDEVDFRPAHGIVERPDRLPADRAAAL